MASVIRIVWNANIPLTFVTLIGYCILFFPSRMMASGMYKARANTPLSFVTLMYIFFVFFPPLQYDGEWNMDRMEGKGQYTTAKNSGTFFISNGTGSGVSPSKGPNPSA